MAKPFPGGKIGARAAFIRSQREGLRSALVRFGQLLKRVDPTGLGPQSTQSVSKITALDVSDLVLGMLNSCTKVDGDCARR